MPRIRLDRLGLVLPGRPAPFSLAGVLPAGFAAPATILKEVSLDLGDSERLALRGAPGSGRSALLRVLAGRLAPTSGACVVEGDIVVVGAEAEGALDPEQTG